MKKWILNEQRTAVDFLGFQGTGLLSSAIIIFIHSVAHNTSEPSRMLLNISEMIVHEDFMALRRANKALQADIALLKLVRPLTFTGASYVVI